MAHLTVDPPQNPTTTRDSNLGASRVRVVWSVVLPTARTGITTAIVLGIARAVGETAPLLFTAFGFDHFNANPFRDPQESLPLFVFKNIRKPSQVSIDRGYAGALVLMLIVLTLFAITRWFGRDRSAQRARKVRKHIAQPHTRANQESPIIPRRFPTHDRPA